MKPGKVKQIREAYEFAFNSRREWMKLAHRLGQERDDLQEQLAEARRERDELREMCRLVSKQSDELAESRVERNAEIIRLQRQLNEKKILPLRYCGQGFSHGPHDWAPFGFDLPNQWRCEGGADQTGSHPDAVDDKW